MAIVYYCSIYICLNTLVVALSNRIYITAYLKLVQSINKCVFIEYDRVWYIIDIFVHLYNNNIMYLFVL